MAASKEKMIMGLLDGKTAIVTGAGSGIGKESAKLLAADGATVVLVGRSVDVLVNNAGSASKTRNVRWIADEEWHQVIDVNLNAVYLLTQAVLPDMLERGSGTIITISSLAAVNPNLLGGAAYGAAKAAVRNFMVYLHNTFRNDGIRATCILPGEVDTPILDNRPRRPTEDERAAMVQPEDVARAVHLAASLPDRTVISELIIAPRRQRDISADLEASRWIGAPAELRAAGKADSSVDGA
jgi:NADP-dependent 3-hydroxy acid dehydrogenase YdfG